MKRADIAFIADIRPKRMDLLKERGQLPFDMPDGGKFTPDHAFRLRLMLDLIGGEDDGLGGLPPSAAAPLVAEALRRCPVHPLRQFTPSDWFAGVAVLERRFVNADGKEESQRWAVTYSGELEQLAEWLEQERKFEAPGTLPGRTVTGRYKVVRVFLANMSRAASIVHRRAKEIGFDTFENKPEASK